MYLGLKGVPIWEFPKIRGVPDFGVLIIRILLFRVLYWGPQLSETPIWAIEGLRIYHRGT